jgi:hypothetical protein
MDIAMFDRDHHSNSDYSVREMEETPQQIMAIFITIKAIKRY